MKKWHEEEYEEIDDVTEEEEEEEKIKLCIRCRSVLDKESCFCKKCGLRVQLSPNPTQKSKTPSLKIGFIVVICFILVIGTIVASIKENDYSSYQSDSSYQSSSNGYLTKNDEYFFYATTVAVEIVESHLSYPKSAEFQSQSSMSVHFDSSQRIYTVKGYVYASNAFGEKSKNNFTVKFTMSISGGKIGYVEKSCNIQ